MLLHNMSNWSRKQPKSQHQYGSSKDQPAAAQISADTSLELKQSRCRASNTGQQVYDCCQVASIEGPSPSGYTFGISS